MISLLRGVCVFIHIYTHAQFCRHFPWVHKPSAPVDARVRISDWNIYIKQIKKDYWHYRPLDSSSRTVSVTQTITQFNAKMKWTFEYRQTISWFSVSKAQRRLLVNSLNDNYFFLLLLLEWSQFQGYTFRKLVETNKCGDRPELQAFFFKHWNLKQTGEWCGFSVLYCCLRLVYLCR